MPELAEVAYHCGRWSPGFGRRIKSVATNARTRCYRDVDARTLEEALTGNQLVGGRTHGKRMLFEFEKGVWLELHLGMTGSLQIRESKNGLERHDHFGLELRDSWLAFNDPRQFGRLELHRSRGVPEFWTALPPTPVSREFDRKRFDAILSRRAKTALKSALLGQDEFPGVGNWMADEILWRARIRPDRAARSLSLEEQTALYNAVRFVCRGAMKYIAPDYSDPPKSWLFRHRWKPGGVCPKTGQPLDRTTIGGRTTCWSPAWQS